MKFSWFGIPSTLLLFTLGSSLMADDTSRSLFDFTGSDAANERQYINDGVMGGVSEGKFKITDKKTLERTPGSVESS